MAYLIRDLDNGHFIERDIGRLAFWAESMIELARAAYFAKQPVSKGGKGVRVLLPYYYDDKAGLRHLTRDERDLFDTCFESFEKLFEKPATKRRQKGRAR